MYVLYELRYTHIISGTFGSILTAGRSDCNRIGGTTHFAGWLTSVCACVCV